MVKKVNLCVVGTGRAGLIHARNIALRIDAAQLVALEYAVYKKVLASRSG